MSATQLYIFNPSTDLALASGSVSYTPPRAVKEMERRMALLPAIYAPTGAYIMVDDTVTISELPYYDLAHSKNIRAITTTELADKDFFINPWGWNKALVHTLIKAGINNDSLPGDADMNSLRELSHRRTSIELYKFLLNRFSNLPQSLPREVSDIDEAYSLLQCYNQSYIKLPWSSSGRGILKVSDGGKSENARRRVIDGIRRQGSIIIEPAWDKALDFASEWICRDGNAKFLGFSVFNIDGKSNYKGNLVASQEHLLNIIRQYISPSCDIQEIIEAQQEAINNKVATKYNGPLGIDMLIDKNGRVNCCVEVNLRMTMGHVAIAASNNGSTQFITLSGY